MLCIVDARRPSRPANQRHETSEWLSIQAHCIGDIIDAPDAAANRPVGLRASGISSIKPVGIQRCNNIAVQRKDVLTLSSSTRMLNSSGGDRLARQRALLYTRCARFGSVWRRSTRAAAPRGNGK